MAKLVLTDVSSSVASSLLTAINNNNALIEEALENTLSRDGTSPNQMDADLDMNSSRVYNLPIATTNTEPVRYGEFSEFVDGMEDAVESAQAAADEAQDWLDQFQDIYLGSFASDPVVDLDGNVLQTGQIYYNTASFRLKYYNGSAWEVAVQPSTDYVLKAGDTLTGNLDFGDNQLIKAVIKDFALKRAAPTISSNAVTLDFTTGNVAEVSLTANLTTITVSNWPPTGELGKMTIILKQDGTGSRTVAFPAGWKWPSAVVPTITSTANKADIFVIMSPDAGTTIYATTAGQNY